MPVLKASGEVLGLLGSLCFYLDEVTENLKTEEVVQKCSIRLSRPHEFSSSIAKLLCLGDEIFESDTGVNAYITPYPKQKEGDNKAKKQE